MVLHDGSRDLDSMIRVTQYAHCPDLTEPLPQGLLADLRSLVSCDQVWVSGQDTPRWSCFADQDYPAGGPEGSDDLFAAFARHYWSSPCSYPDRTGDIESVTMGSDFLTDRQNHQTGMYVDYCQPMDVEHEIRVCLPAGGPGRTLRVMLIRGTGSDFTERDRAVLTVLRPHIYAAFVAGQRYREGIGITRLTTRQREVLGYVSAGSTNRQIARLLGISERTVEKHIEGIFERLGVTSRTTAAVRHHDELLQTRTPPLPAPSVGS